MRIYTGENIKIVDQLTMERQGISSLELMERVAEEIAQWLCNNVESEDSLLFLIGKGNNGGDGLAVARIMANAGFKCRVKMLFEPSELSEECLENFDRLPENIVVAMPSDRLTIAEDDIVVDAMLGVGVRGVVRDPVGRVIDVVNNLPNRVIAIDMPSGMPTEFGGDIIEANDLKIIEAETTLTIGFPKLSIMLPQYGNFAGNLQVVDIDISDIADIEVSDKYIFATSELMHNLKSNCPQRKKFGYKSEFGHTLMVCGSKEMMGAAILATSGALRSGCGLVTSHIPESGCTAMNASCPSAMISLDTGDAFSHIPQKISKYNAIGIGCGIGQNEKTIEALTGLLHESFQTGVKLVLDADALNIIAEKPELKQYIPHDSILTPHIGELKRLCPEWRDEYEMLQAVRKLSFELKSIVILKGAHTAICNSDGSIMFNSTGTPGMAKGGSGDVLTGYVSGLLARGYDSLTAAVLGVYVHGLAGEKAATYYGVEAMNSSDIIDFLSEAMAEI